MRVLGIDPGWSCAGFAVVEFSEQPMGGILEDRKPFLAEHKAKVLYYVTLSTKATDWSRAGAGIGTIYQMAVEKYKPDLVAIEDFQPRDYALGLAYGWMMFAVGMMYSLGADIRVVHAATAKAAVAGDLPRDGRAKGIINQRVMEQVQGVDWRKLSEAKRAAVADAVAVAAGAFRKERDETQKRQSRVATRKTDS